MPEAPKVIVFDLGGVVAGDVHGEVIKSFAPTPEAQKHAESVARVAWTSYKLGKIGEFEFWEYISKNTEIIQWIPDDLKTQHESDVDLLASLLRKNHITVYYETVALALRLKRSGYRLAVLSNHARDWIDVLFERYRLFDIFTEQSMVIISSDVNTAKPDREIYELLMKRIRKTCGQDIQEDQVLFIDDKIDNIIAANNLGIRGICFNSETDLVSNLKQALKDQGVQLKK